MLMSLKVALKTAVSMVSLEPAGSGSPAPLSIYLVVSVVERVEKHVINLNIHRAGTEYLPPATDVIMLPPHHHTLLKKDTYP